MSLSVRVHRPSGRALRLIALVLAGILSASTVPARADDAPASAAPATTPAKPAANLPPDVVARVNGQPVTRAELAEKLLRYYGDRALDSIIQQILIRQEAASVGIKATKPDVEQALAEFYARDTFPKGMPLSERKRVWADLLTSRGLTQDDFVKDIEAEILLSKLVRRRINVTDDEVRREFDRRYGERLDLSQIVVANEEECRKLYDRLKAGESFAELAKRFSLDRRTGIDGGRLTRPLSRGQVGRAYEDAAFALQEGQFSIPFETPEGWCILKLDKRLPADKVTFDKVKDLIRDDLTRLEETEMRSTVLAEIIRKANIERARLVPDKD